MGLSRYVFLAIDGDSSLGSLLTVYLKERYEGHFGLDDGTLDKAKARLNEGVQGNDGAAHLG